MSDTKDLTDTTVHTINEDLGTTGSIQINHDVVANIVRLATLEVPGVVGVGGARLKENLTEMFSSNSGVKVTTNEADEYLIEIKVILKFGVELAKTGQIVQQTIIEYVEKMTSKNVARVDIFIDAVRHQSAKEEPDDGDVATPKVD